MTPLERDGVSMVEKRVTARARGDEAERALAREASFLAMAHHPALPRLISTSRDAAGLFVIEERVSGESLASIAERFDAGLPFHLACRIARDAAVALSEIHALADADGPLELVHGDPSLENLFFGAVEGVHFVDLGGASYRGMADPPSRGAGTLPYSAPELVRGEATVSRETDVYALAAVVLRLLVGPELTSAETEAAKVVEIGERGISTNALARLSGWPALTTALRRLLAFDPRARETSLADLVRALSSLLLTDLDGVEHD